MKLDKNQRGGFEKLVELPQAEEKILYKVGFNRFILCGDGGFEAQVIVGLISGRLKEYFVLSIQEPVETWLLVLPKDISSFQLPASSFHLIFNSFGLP